MTDKNRQLLKSSLINSQIGGLIKDYIQTEAAKSALMLRTIDANKHSDISYQQGKLDGLDGLLMMFEFNRQQDKTKEAKTKEAKTDNKRFSYLYSIFSKK